MTRRELFAALSAPNIRAGLFVEIMLDEPVRAFSGIGNATTPDGRVWSGLGGVGRVSAIETTEKVEAAGFSVGFQIASGMVPNGSFDDLMAAYIEARKTDVKRRSVSLSLGAFDDLGGMIGDDLIPIGFGVGSHLTSSYQPGGSLTMTLACEGRLSAGFPLRASFLIDTDQKTLFPGDRGLEGVGPLASGGRLIVWRAGV